MLESNLKIVLTSLLIIFYSYWTLKDWTYEYVALHDHKRKSNRNQKFLLSDINIKNFSDKSMFDKFSYFFYAIYNKISDPSSLSTVIFLDILFSNIYNYGIEFINAPRRTTIYI